MRIEYFEKDDTLVIHVADKPIAQSSPLAQPSS